MPTRQVVNNCLDRDARSCKHRRSAHNVWRAGNNLSFNVGFHADNRSTGREFRGSRLTSELTGHGGYIQPSIPPIKLTNTLSALRSNDLSGVAHFPKVIIEHAFEEPTFFCNCAERILRFVPRCE